jgi:hypothetical protein
MDKVNSNIFKQFVTTLPNALNLIYSSCPYEYDSQGSIVDIPAGYGAGTVKYFLPPCHPGQFWDSLSLSSGYRWLFPQDKEAGE